MAWSSSPDPDALTIDEFCRRHGLSRPFYYKIKAQGLGPREIKLNSKVLITREAASDWRRERELETARQRDASERTDPLAGLNSTFDHPT